MAGKKEGLVRESIDELYRMVDQMRSERQQARIRMLLLFKEDDSTTMEDVARHTNRCERMVRRWWRIYQEGGVEALLRGKPGAVLEARPVEQRRTGEGRIGSQLLGVLNALPDSSDTLEWIERFRGLFGSLFSDIDRVSINIDIDAELTGWKGGPVTYVTQNVCAEGEMPVHLQTTVNVGSSAPGNDLGEAVRRHKALLETYSSPHRFDYHTAEGAYLGSILLWREKRMGPISEATLQSVRDLTPFLTFMLTDCIARRQMEDPGVRTFTATLATIAEKEKLTRRQQEVLTHGLLGRTHAETARALGISAHAVRGHVRAIHLRTNTRNLLELFARYFTPFQERRERRRR